MAVLEEKHRSAGRNYPIFNTMFGSRGGTVVEDGCWVSLPFGSMVACGWGRRWWESGGASGSCEEWRERREYWRENHVTHEKLPCYPSYYSFDSSHRQCQTTTTAMHRSCNEIPDFGSGILLPQSAIWIALNVVGESRCVPINYWFTYIKSWLCKLKNSLNTKSNYLYRVVNWFTGLGEVCEVAEW